MTFVQGFKTKNYFRIYFIIIKEEYYEKMSTIYDCYGILNIYYMNKKP